MKPLLDKLFELIDAEGDNLFDNPREIVVSREDGKYIIRDKESGKVLATTDKIVHVSGKGIKVESTNVPDDLMDRFEELANRLSPENLSCDGECPRAEVNRKRAAIEREWRELEKEAGRKVSEQEVWARAMKRERDR